MSPKSIWRNRIGPVVGGVIAALAVTAASYIWRLPQAWGRWAVLVVYLMSALLLSVAAFVIFRRIVRRGYEQHRRLTSFSLFLELLIWGLFFAFPCIYNPYSWAWSQSPTSQVIPVLGVVGWACVCAGLVVVAITLGWLGLPRSCGQDGRRLEISGPYRVTRNPQLMGGTLLIVGYVVLWPSWYALGWVALFALMSHLMIRTEEEHLRRIHGEAYEAYCKQVPRYLRFPPWFTRTR